MSTSRFAGVKSIGYGAMVLEGYYGESDDAAAVKTLVHAIDQGMMIDTADFYGGGHNEELVKQAIQQTKTKPFIATKFGLVFDENQPGRTVNTGWGYSLTVNGAKDYTARAIDDCLKRLGVEQIDLLYVHYPDPETPVEETVAAMAEAVKAGKVKHIGLSNYTGEEILRGHEVHPIAAVQYEYSLFRREAELDILPAVNQIGASLVCWSPLGGGFLTGELKKLDENDFRNSNPKMQGDNFTNNLKRLEAIEAIAVEYGISPAQLALAWLVAQGDNIIPIPGSRKTSRIDENLKALSVKLTPETLAQLDEIAPIGAFEGGNLL